MCACVRCGWVVLYIRCFWPLTLSSPLDNDVLINAYLALFPLPLQCDLTTDIAHKYQLDYYCQQDSYLNWFETSAKTNVGIKEAIQCLVQKVRVGRGRWEE